MPITRYVKKSSHSFPLVFQVKQALDGRLTQGWTGTQTKHDDSLIGQRCGPNARATALLHRPIWWAYFLSSCVRLSIIWTKKTLPNNYTRLRRTHAMVDYRLLGCVNVYRLQKCSLLQKKALFTKALELSGAASSITATPRRTNSVFMSLFWILRFVCCCWFITITAF